MVRQHCKTTRDRQSQARHRPKTRINQRSRRRAGVGLMKRGTASTAMWAREGATAEIKNAVPVPSLPHANCLTMHKGRRHQLEAAKWLPALLPWVRANPGSPPHRHKQAKQTHTTQHKQERGRAAVLNKHRTRRSDPDQPRRDRTHHRRGPTSWGSSQHRQEQQGLAPMKALARRRVGRREQGERRGDGRGPAHAGRRRRCA